LLIENIKVFLNATKFLFVHKHDLRRKRRDSSHASSYSSCGENRKSRYNAGVDVRASATTKNDPVNQKRILFR